MKKSTTGENPSLEPVVPGAQAERYLWALLAVAILLPVALIAWFAWMRYDAVFKEAELVAQRSAVAIEQHMASVMETHALLLQQVMARVADTPDDEISCDRSLQLALAKAVSRFEQVAVIGVTDSDGMLLVTSLPDSPQISVAHRDFFREHLEEKSHGVFISRPYTGVITGRDQFAISAARLSASGQFQGIVYATLPLGYLTDFWQQFVPSKGYLVPLMRSDGTVLSRYPTLEPPARLDPQGPFITNIRLAPIGVYRAISLVDGIERLNAYRRVAHYPLYVSFSTETAIIEKTWRSEILPAVLVALVAAAALAGLGLAAIRHARNESWAMARWRSTAQELRTEIQLRESVEAQLRQSQKMEALGQLTGGIAHDFNNMLASVVANLELGKTYLSRQDIDRADEFIDGAAAIIDRASTMIDRLLSFGRRNPLEPRPVDVNDLLASVRDIFNRAVGHDIAVVMNLSEEPVVAICDPVQLETALLNLVINSRDAIESTGTVVIRSRKLDQMVQIEVEDDGKGMDPEVAERAYEPFFTTKATGQGTGLGLSMVFGFCQQSNGSVKIHTAPGKGTRVVLTLPGQETADSIVHAAASLAPPTQKRNLNGKAVLIVEDNEDLMFALTRALQENGAKVSPAANGPEALALLQETTPDIVVTDIRLKGKMDGFQVADAVHAAHPDLPIIFMTGYTDLHSAGLARGLRIIRKPFKVSLFLDTVSAVLGK